MKKLMILGMGVCVAFAFSSCKSSESAYKKAYEKAKQQELAVAPAEEAQQPTQVVTNTVSPAPTAVASGPVREERVQLVSGQGLKAYSVVCGSFGVKANADALKERLDNQGYSALVVFNAERNMYRVITSSFDTRAEASQARDAFKDKYPDNVEFQKSWLLYNIN